MPSSAEQPQPLGRVVMAVKDWIGRLNEIWIDAQVIEIRRRSGPTQFLTFRDRVADISATVTVSSLVLDSAGPLPEGSRVTARVRPRIWERNSSLSFECLELQVAGEGQLLARLERLRRALQAEGLFDAARKRRLPVIPRRIGLVTAAGSDAERDVLTNVEKRWPAKFEVAHALVQGTRSAESVMLAVQKLDEHPQVDVIVIARGGGSLEDLMSFSDEGLIRCVAAAKTPTISAIGHEQDTPLLDFVADVRASTPTAAATLVVPDFATEQERLATAKTRLHKAITRQLEQRSDSLRDLKARGVLADPMRAYAAHYDKLALLRYRLSGAITSKLKAEQQVVDRALQGARTMSPRATLERGYAVLTGPNQHSVTSINEVETGGQVRALLADGDLELKVEKITPKEANE